MDLKTFFSYKENKFFWNNIIGFVVAVFAIIFLAMTWLDIYTNHGDVTTVPDVKGMTAEEAAKMFRNHDLTAVISDSIFVKDQPLNTIIESNPVAGSSVKEGRIIYLTINSGSVPMVKLPDLINNSSYRQANIQLMNSGFQLTDPEHVGGEPDWIYGVKYNGRELNNGDEIPEGATLTLVVGGGGSLEEDSLSIESDEPSVPETETKPTVRQQTNTAKSSSNDDNWF